MFTIENQGKNALTETLEQVARYRGGADLGGLGGTQNAYFLYRLYDYQKHPMVIILPTVKMAERFLTDFEFFAKRKSVPCLFFPSYNLLPYKFLSYHNETAARRISVLYQIDNDQAPPVVITTPEAILQKLIPRNVLNDYAELVMVDEEIERDQFLSKLSIGGYTRTAIVEEPGDYCVRGGILDVFSPLYEHPVRIEFFGDLVESLRFFSATSQRTLESTDEVVILPARESVLYEEKKNTIIGNIRAQASEQQLPFTKIRDIVSKIRDEGTFTGMESLLSLIYDEPGTLFDYLPDNSLFVQVEPAALKTSAEDYLFQAQNTYNASCKDEMLCAPPDSLYLTWPEVQTSIESKKVLRIKQLQRSAPETAQLPVGEMVRGEVNFSIQENEDIRTQLIAAREKERLFGPLQQWISRQSQSGHQAIVTCQSHSQAERLTSLLIPYDCPCVIYDGFPDSPPPAGSLAVCVAQVSNGFVWPDAALSIMTEEEIFGTSFRKRKKIASPAPTQMLALEDLTQNDLVVHLDHGIGQYQGLVKLKLDGTTNDFLLVSYKDNDKLYLPVDRMNMIQKYMGVDGIAPILDKLGGKSWERVKERVKRSTEKIAGELLQIFAARKVETGYPFQMPDQSYGQFEAAFPYEETVDQKKAIEDVIEDMGRKQPMDRLVCGDVGYGKTEVALRASFVAVHNGKQVAVLVPTTILAEQHFQTFAQRFKGHPLFVECLSRFRKASEQRAIVQRLKEGKIDVIIGTHRLLSKDVSFKNLGLIILDEEQRFGVTHKEKLKKLRKTVDVLALTATPIPRTLHLSLVGIRDISVISTPPEQRHPIVTYVTELDDATIANAVRKELKRGGQIFFVHNHISTIHAMAGKLKRIVPEVTLSVAHGQMDEAELEEVMIAFMQKKIDMLVCTTIIESGLDISSANTILINRADRFGLAQIYQLRGRVGRGEEQAYAYLFIPPDSVMTRDAQKRLKVLMEHSDLGSGFQIAMSDLKIRGGGTILGASQSGHVAAVGYDMFLKLMETSVAELKGEPQIPPLDPEINLPLSAYLPESYIPDIDQRLAAYRRLTNLTHPSEISEFKAEMADRFGPLPAEVANLLMKIMLRVLAIRSGVKRLDINGRNLMLHFSTDHQKNHLAIVDLITEMPDKYQLTPDHVMKISLSEGTMTGILAQIKNNLKDISQRVNA